jgi:cysteine desulfurase
MQRHYFDYNATTPVDRRVLDTMLPTLSDTFGNPSSVHGFGQDAKRLVEHARRRTAELLGCAPKEVVFTSGGTESDNLALFGTLRPIDSSRNHVITTTIEHPAVLQACEQLEREGAEVSYVRVGADGVVSPDDIRAALRPQTAIISVMTANNELGTLQPIREISRIAREAGVRLHTDGVQATGKIPTAMDDLGADFFALSAHKIYGPKGIGALYIRKGVEVDNIQFGGSQERGRRPGTTPVPGIVGLGAAAEIAAATLAEEAPRLSALRDRLETGLLERISDAWVNCAASPRAPNTSNMGFEGVEGEPMVIALDLKGFAVSSGAACSSGAVEPSHVLTAIGLRKDRARSCLRFSLGRQTTAEQIDALIEVVPVAVERLRKLSPAYA